MDSGLDASHRPGMTEERILDPDRARWRRSISQEDLEFPVPPRYLTEACATIRAPCQSNRLCEFWERRSS